MRGNTWRIPFAFALGGILACGETEAASMVGADPGGQAGQTSGGGLGAGASATGGASTGADGVGANGGSGGAESGGGGSDGGPGAGGETYGGFSTIFTIVLENHDYNEIVGSSDAPYLNSLIEQYGLATNYFDSGTHPSLPNYLYMISGDTQYPGVIDVGPKQLPYFPSDSDNLGNQMEQAGIAWRSYQESMGSPCSLEGNGSYAPKHNPFIYFDNIQNGPDDLCGKRNVDYSQFADDLATGAYKYMWITPNLVNDGHDPMSDPELALSQSDDWLSIEVPKILQSQAYLDGGVLFVTWDEAEGRDGNSEHQVPMIVISPKLLSAGMKVDIPLDHASYLATVEDIFGLPRLGAATSALTLMPFFQP